MGNRYKHIFFDLDHTLWDFETNSKETLLDLYNLHNLDAKGIPSFEAFFKSYTFHNKRLWERYTMGYIKQEELKWKRMWLTLLDFKIADEQLSRQLSLEFLEHLPSKKNLFPHTFEILDYLKSKGYHLHLITNGFEKVQYSKLERSGLRHYFKEVITSEASNNTKPNKEIFDYAFSKTNAKAEESIMIGDNLDADIQGGINAGMDTVFVNHIDEEAYLKPTYIVRNLKELERIF
jgi:putative hydrolase of the HAD superfamily